MFKDKLKFLKSKSEEEGDNKKKIENMVFLVIVLIITIVVINYIWNGSNKSNKTFTNSTGKQLASTQVNDSKTASTYSENDLEVRLEQILKTINGVGEVKVFINYSESSETVAMYNENSKTSVTEETDTSGGVRKVEETNSDKEIVYQENNGNKTPIIQKTVQPKIEGAIVTAEGASNINIKTSIIQAVEAATGLSTHKIQVFEMSF